MANQSGKVPCYCIKLRRATGNITEYYDQMLQPVGLTLNQFSLLGSINKLGVCSVIQLAREVGLEKSTLVRTLKPLFVVGYVADTSIKGSRNRQLRVTKDGLLALYRGNILWQDAQEKLRMELGKDNVELLLGMLEHLEGVQA